MDLSHLSCFAFFQIRSCCGAQFIFELELSDGPSFLSSGITTVKFHTWFVFFFFLLSLSFAKQCFKATLNLKFLLIRHLKGEYQRLVTQKIHSGICRVGDKVPTAYFIPQRNSVHTVSILEIMRASQGDLGFGESPRRKFLWVSAEVCLGVS